jgi:hypothetical protein
MLFRSVLIISAFAAASPASAQKAPPPPAIRMEALEERPAHVVASARDMVRAIYIESGIVEMAVDLANSERMPQIVESVRQSAMYRDLPQHRRTALEAYLNTLDDLVAEIINEAVAGTIETGAAGTLGLYSDDEILAIGAFLASEPARETLRALMRSVVEAETSGQGFDAARFEPTPEQQGLFDEFGQTPAGARFLATGGDWFVMLTRAFESRTALASAGVGDRVQRDMCAILESDCPPHIRARFPSAAL